MGHDRIWPKPHLAKKSEFGQVIFVTAFGQFQCFSVFSNFSGVVVVVACCCLLLLVVACWCLKPRRPDGRQGSHKMTPTETRILGGPWP